MREVTDGVYVEDRYSTYGNYHGCNWAFVETGGGIVAVDTPEWPSDAVAYRDDLADRGEVRYLVNTHKDIDHVTGNRFVPGRRISHELVRANLSIPPDFERSKSLLTHMFPDEKATEMIETVEAWGPGGFDWEDFLRLLFAELDPASLEYLDGYEMAPPEVTFSDEATLHVGDCTVELLHAPGHTTGHIAVYVPERSVLFAGDNVTTECYPSLPGSDPHAWLDSLDRLAALDVDTVVPGHGPVAGPEAITEFRSFLRTAMDRVERARDELSVEAAMDSIDFDDLRPQLHPMERSRREDVEYLYETLA
jgi:cyclase